MGAIQEIFRLHGPSYIDKFGDSMPENHLKTINSIVNCRTEAFGFTVYECEECGKSHRIYRGCGNRHCPTCQHLKTFQWTKRLMENRLPVHSFLATFTVPAGLRDFIRSHQKDAYGALFKSSSEAMKKPAADPKHIGGDVPGFF